MNSGNLICLVFYWRKAIEIFCEISKKFPKFQKRIQFVSHVLLNLIQVSHLNVS